MDELEQRKKDFFRKLKGFISEQPQESKQAADKSQPQQDISIQKAKEVFEKLNFGRKNWLYWLGLIPVLIIGWYVRIQNLSLLAGKYLIELDSYFFFRYAKIIYETGTLPAIDMMRFVPLGYTTAPFKFFSMTLTYMYKFVHAFFPSMTQIQWHIYYPPVITIISFVFFFLFVKELFGNKIAWISTAFLAVIPAYIQRTSAGFADHEAMAMLWMFISLWFIALMIKSRDIKKILFFSMLSAIFAAMMIQTWGGYRYLTLAVGIFFVLAVYLSKIDKYKFAGIITWFVITFVAISFYFSRGLSLSMLTNFETMPFMFGILSWCIINALPKIKQANFLTEKLTLHGAAAVIAIIAVLIIGAATGMLKSFVYEFLAQAFKMSYTQGASRFWMTVSESQRPQFFGGSGLWGNFGWLTIISIFGGGLLFYYILRKKQEGGLLKNKMAIAGAAAMSAFLLIFILGSFENSSTIGQFFSNTLVYWFFAILAAMVFVFYKLFKNFDAIFSEENLAFLLMLSIFIIGFIVSHNQIRMLFAFAPPAAIASAFTIEKLRVFAYKTKPSQIITVLFALLVIYLIYSSGQVALAFNRGSGSMVPGQWESAMTFLREQTPKDSVIAHWWDYGHMTIAVGERAAVTDGGNVRSWNHDSGRYFLTGKERDMTFSYLKTHNVTHILISEEEIPKYHAFSLIGSEENFDRYTQIGIFSQQQQREVRDGTMLIYGGGWPLDNNIVVGNLILPANGAAIGGFSIIADNSTLKDPIAYVVYNGQQYQFGISCVYLNGQKLQFEQNNTQLVNGCIVLAPDIIDQNQANPIGVLFWLSEKSYDTNLARLYMYDENDPNFKLVYSDNTPLGLYQGRIIGPIKIWEVIYPVGVKTNSIFLENSKYG